MSHYINTRRFDYDSSVAGERKVEESSHTVRRKLRAAYQRAGTAGLTDEQAAFNAGVLDTCYWKRCGELRHDGVIEWSGHSRKGLSGVQRKISVIADTT